VVYLILVLGGYTLYSIGIGFTAKCNMDCAFCYSKEKRNELGQLPLSVWKNFIVCNADAINAINYGTGECSLSDEWYEFIAFVRCYAPEIRQAVTTNGTLATVVDGDSAKMKVFEECIEEVDVSLDFADKTAHNLGRNCENAFDWVLKMLDMCKRMKKRSTVVLVGMELTLTCDNLNRIFRIASEKDATVRINMYRPVNRASPMRPPRLHVITEAFRWISTNGRFLVVSDPLFSSIYFDKYEGKDPSGRTSLRIVQNGDIYPSTYLLASELCIGNVREATFEKMKSSAIVRQFGYASIPEACLGCEWYKTCGGGTLDRRYLMYGTLDERDPYCPHRPENVSMYERLNIIAPVAGYESIHGDYLPTIIAEAKQ